VGKLAAPVGGSWRSVKPLPGTEVWAYRLKGQEPGKDDTGQIIATNRKVGKGQVTAIHGDLFKNYYLGHFPPLRRFIANLVDQMKVNWLVEVNASARMEMILRQKNGSLMINLINRGAGEALSPRRVMVEELPLIEDINLRVHLSKAPSKITAPFEPGEISWKWQNGYVDINLDKLHIHNTIVIEK